VNCSDPHSSRHAGCLAMLYCQCQYALDKIHGQRDESILYTHYHYRDSVFQNDAFQESWDWHCLPVGLLRMPDDYH
jgi:hypothetical protein